MALSYVQYTGDGSNRNFNIPFAYLSRSHIAVKVDGIAVTFAFLSDTQVQATVAPFNGAVVEVRRTTPNNSVLVDFNDGSTLTESNLDTSFLQNYYLAQESFDLAEVSVRLASDGAMDAQNRRIKNVLTPTASSDAVTKAYVDAISVAAGNVPTPNNPADDNKVIRATGGTFGWFSFLKAWISDAGAFGLSWLGLTDAAAGRASLGLEYGTLRGFLSGFALSNNVTDAVNDIDIGPGVAADGTNDTLIKLAATITKRLDASWVVGSNQGGLDTGTKQANTWYHLWAIRRSDTGVVDVLFSTSATAPTMPTGYDRKRYIRSVRTDGSGNIRGFKHRGNQILWDTPIQDASGAATTNASRTNYTLTTPLGRKVEALYHVGIDPNAGSSALVMPSDPDMADPGSPSGLATGLQGVGGNNATGGRAFDQVSTWTNTSSQIALRASISGATVGITLIGWNDTCGRFD